MAAHRYIYPIKAQNGTVTGWAVQVRVNGKVQSETFSASKFGGNKDALTAALAHRDELVERHGLTARLLKAENPHPGVSRTDKARIDRGRERQDAYWQAYWTNADGKQHTERFSISKLGEEAAKAAAIAARKHAERSLAEGRDPFFLPPASRRARLWRYMDFTKFLSLIEDRSLFFSNSANFEDPYEGTFSRSNVAHRNFVLSRSVQPSRPRLSEDSPFAISCWYCAPHESAAMWKLYAQTNEAVAICTTYDKLRKTIPEWIDIGLVRYADYGRQWISERDPSHRFMYKRLSFEHENELRAILNMEDPRAILSGIVSGGNFKIGVDLNRLLTEVYVSPEASDWFFDLVCKVSSRYGIRKRPVRSSLYDTPDVK